MGSLMSHMFPLQQYGGRVGEMEAVVWVLLQVQSRILQPGLQVYPQWSQLIASGTPDPGC